MNHLLVGLIVFLSLPVFADTTPNRRYLAVDPTLHTSVEGLDLVMGQARHVQVLWKQFDAAWEKEHGLALGALGNVVRDHEGRFRLYYEFMHENAKRATAVAFSDDGVHWTKPALNLAPEIVDVPESNLIAVSPSEDGIGRGLLDGKWYRGAHAFYDAHASDSEARYKLVWRQGHDIYVATSPDGLRFTTHGRAVDYYADTSPSHFYDPLREAYVIYGRIWHDKEDRPTLADRLGADGKPPTRRGVVLHQTKDWSKTPWPAETTGNALIDPMDVFRDGGWTDVYTPNVQVYHGQYIGLPGVYFRRLLPDYRDTAGPLYPVFMHSVDGRKWHFPSLDHPIVNLTPHLLETDHGMEAGMIFPAASVVEQGDELWIYYCARGYQHNADSPGDREDVTYNRAVLRRDGFASLRATGDTPGVWRTPVMKIPEDVESLRVNARVAGSLEVLLVEPGTEGIKGSLSFTGDEPDGYVHWEEDDIAALAGREYHIQFEIQDGEIFSFRFEPGDPRYRREATADE